MNLTPIPLAINHLLEQQPWARDKLAAHAGKVAVIDLQAAKLRLAVRPGGLVGTAQPEQAANVTIHLKLADLALLLQNRDQAFSYVRLEGDADFANALSQLSHALRWDAQADLARLVGDIAAVRIAGAGRSAIKTADTVARKLAENTAEYLLDENPLLVRPSAVAELGAGVIKLRDDVERLMKRIEKLEGRR